MSNTIVWVDIPVRDLDRAIAFYTAVLGAEVRRERPNGTVEIGMLPHAGTSGCLYLADDNTPSANGPLIYFDCSGRLDAALAAVATHGGTVLQPRHEIGVFGERVVALDSEGNRIGLHEPPAA